MSNVIITPDPAAVFNVGRVTSYADAVAGGYTGTREEWERDLANLGTTAAEVEANRQAVAEDKAAVEGDVTTVGEYKEVASAAAAAALQSAESAHTDALAATAAKEAAQSAQGIAEEARTDAVSAKGAAESAQTEANTSASAASESALAAGNAAQMAAAQAGAASDSATAAAASAAAAAESARTLTIDTTLTQAGQAAEAKAVGENIADLKSALDPLLIDTYNKLDVNALTPNKYEPTGTGAPASYNGWSLSDYIPITSNDNYYFVIKNSDSDNYSNVTGSNLYVGYYNAGKTKIAGVVGSPIHNSDTGLAYVRVSAPTDYFSRYAMVVDAATRSNISTIADYEEYGKKTIPVVEEISAIKSRLSDAEADIAEIQQVVGEGAMSIDPDVTAVMEKITDYYTDYLPAPPTSFDDDSYLESKIKQIPDGYSIIHISDVHCDHGTDYNAWHSIDLMNYVRKRANIGKVVFSGDILNVIQNTYDSDGHVLTPSKYTAKKELAKFLYGCRRVFRDDFYAAVGDHDANLAGSFDTDYKTEAYAGQYVPYGVVEPLFFGDLKNRHNAIEYYQSKLDAIHDRSTNPISDDDYNELIAFFKTVFYIDDPQNKIRWITMNCGKSAAPYGSVYNVFGITSTEIFRIQFAWLNSVLLSTPAGYNIILHSHKASFNSGSMRGAIKMLNALKNKTSCNPDYTAAGSAELEAWWAYNTSYNYAAAPDVGWTLSIAGHTHEDDIYVKGGGYDFAKYAGETLTDSSTPCVEINCDAYSTMVGHTTPMEYGTITEQCFDVMTFVDDGIVMTRFGAGNDRRIYIDRS